MLIRLPAMGINPDYSPGLKFDVEGVLVPGRPHMQFVRLPFRQRFRFQGARGDLQRFAGGASLFLFIKEPPEPWVAAAMQGQYLPVDKDMRLTELIHKQLIRGIQGIANQAIRRRASW